MNITTAEEVKKGPNPVFLLVMSVLVMISASFSSFKLSPIIPDLMEYWGVGEGLIGILQSSKDWVTVFLLIPIGLLLKKIAPRYSGFIFVAMMAAGGLIGRFAPTFPVLVIGRVIEGVGSVSLNVLTQSIVVTSFTGKRTTATSILNCGIMVGGILYLNIAPVLVNNGGWQTVYTYAAVVQAIVAVIWLLTINKNYIIGGDNAAKKERTEKTKLRNVITKDLVLISIAMVCMSTAATVFGNFVPTYLTTRGMTIQSASSLYSVATFIGMFAMIGFGILADKLKTKRKIAIITFYASILCFVLLGLLPIELMFIYIISFGVLPKSYTGLTFASVPETLENEADASVGSSFLMTVNTVANIVGSVIIGFLIQYMGYPLTIAVMAGLCFLAGTLWIFARRIK